MTVDAFFAYARERHSTHLRRAAGLPRSEWTSDPILQQYRFCNVYRELDRTTQWFRTHVRDPLRDTPEVLLATVLFRWFNRIQTGEAIFSQNMLNLMTSPGWGADADTPWEYLASGAPDGIERLAMSIRSYCGRGPYVTGSYIIKTPDGRDKLDGVLWCVEQFMTQVHYMPGVASSLSWRQAASLEKDACVTLEMIWQWLCEFSYLGPFMAYEVVTDLRHTSLLDRATDIMTWANPGPGARRGLNRIHGRPLENATPRAQLIKEMRELLEASHDNGNWGFRRFDGPPGNNDWPAWEMREVEHTLCEFDKYERARLGEGRPRQVFR